MDVKTSSFPRPMPTRHKACCPQPKAGAAEGFAEAGRQLSMGALQDHEATARAAMTGGPIHMRWCRPWPVAVGGRNRGHGADRVVEAYQEILRMPV